MPKLSETVKETRAMQTCGSTLDDLKEEGRKRVLRWLQDKYGDATDPSGAMRRQKSKTNTSHDVVAVPEYAEFPELLAASNAKTDPERALVAGYWLQYGPDPKPNFVSMDLNKLLKDSGHPIKNITEAINGLKAKRPQLVVQLAKKGTAKQARKTLKLSTPGKERMEAMLRGESIESE